MNSAKTTRPMKTTQGTKKTKISATYRKAEESTMNNTNTTTKKK
jgi:hypothetical protein